MPKLNQAFTFILLTISVLLLSACSNDASNQKQQNHINGNAVKGIISNGIVSAYEIQPETSSKSLLGQARTDNSGNYSLPLPELEDDALVILELTSDALTTMTCDLVEGCVLSGSNYLAEFGTQIPLPESFTLLGYLPAQDSYNAFLSPLSHITIATASSLSGGLSEQNIATASQWVAQTFELEGSLLSIKTPDITALSSLSNLSDEQLKQGILSAVFYDLSMTEAWSAGTVNLDTLPLEALFSDAASLAQTLADQLDQSETGYTSSLAAISSDVEAQYQEIASQALVITEQPDSISVDENTSFSLRVQTGGEGPISYQWKKDDQNIPGATSASYSKANATLSDTGSYSVEVSNSVESISSLYALVLVNEVISPVSIIEQPQALNLTAGDSLNLSVSVAGDGPFSYQWQKGGSVIPGATNSTLTIANSDKSDEGNYRVIISNTVSEVSSDFVSVIVNIPVAPIAIVQQPQTQTVTEGSAASFNVTATGGGYISYQWRKNGININNAFTNSLAISTSALTDAGSYDVIVSNSRGGVISQTATLSVLPAEAPVSITLQPVSNSVYVSDSINLRVVATGGGSLSYQWYFNGAVIPGATQADYSIDNASLSDEGAYSVTVHNLASNAESLAAFISVTPRPLSTVMLSWDIPTQREDNSALELYDIGAYIIEYGNSPSNLSSQVRINEASTTEYTLEGLTPGMLYVRIATIDAAGIQGQFSELISVIIE